MNAKPIETVCIVGAGFMGAQIGLHCASQGYTVWIMDISEEAREPGFTEPYTRTRYPCRKRADHHEG